MNIYINKYEHVSNKCDKYYDSISYVLLSRYTRKYLIPILSNTQLIERLVTAIRSKTP